MKDNKDSYSQAELAKAISEFETSLKIMENSENIFCNSDKIKSLRESVVVLKG